ncbi:MAG: tetratricopeptide repeat protein [Bryobacteraceae bacterium]|jgi:tetratricopeptide (TPR) repeat protein
MLAAAQRRLGHNDDAIVTLRQLVKIAPQNTDGVLELAAALFEGKRYSDAIEPLQAVLKTEPDNAKVEMSLVEAQLRGGAKAAGLADLAKMREGTMDAYTLNSAAWVLSDTKTDSALAKELAQRAVADYEKQLKGVTLSSLTGDDLKLVDSSALRGIRSVGQPFVWGISAYLGQIYQRQGKKTEAIHAYQLALAVNSDLAETRERLEKLGGSTEDRPTLRRGAPASPRVSPEDELSELRTSPVPGLKYQHGTAEFFLLFSASGMDDSQFIRGDEDLKPAAGALGKLHYRMPFPDEGPEKIARRGILSCSQVTTPNCTFVLLLPANTTK